MKKFLACLIAVLFLFESVSVGVPKIVGRLSANAEEEVEGGDAYGNDEGEWEDELGDEEDEFEEDVDEYDDDIADEAVEEWGEDGNGEDELTEDAMDEDASPLDVFRATKSRMKSNILERTASKEEFDDEEEYGDDEDFEDDTDDIDDDENEDEDAVDMPADQLSEETPQGIHVQAAFGEDVFPENTRMELADVPRDEALEAVSKVFDNVVDVVAVDIAFLDENGEELEPEVGGEVEVSLSLNAPLQKGEQAVVHIDDEGNAEEVAQVHIVTATETGAEFVADAFSTYAIVTKTDTSASYQALEADGFVYEILGDSKLSLHTMPAKESVTVSSTITDTTGASYTVTKALGAYDSSDNHTGVGGRTNGGQKKITLANTITEIGKNAFSDIKDGNGEASLTSVTLPSKLQIIGEAAFSGNENLVAIEIPDAVTTIGKNAFAGCGLKSVFIPKNVTSIGEKAFGWDAAGNAIDGFVIYGYTGSAAATYATNSNITFVSVGTAASSSSSSASATSSSGSTSTTKSSSSSSSDSDDEKDDDDDDDSSSSSSSSFSTGDTKTYSSKSGLNKAEYEKTGSSTVTYNEAKVSSSSKVARVAGKVKISSKTYKVTEVAENAFSDYKNLKKVKIGQYVEVLDENMIANCPNLTKLVINSKKLTADNVKNSLKGSNVKKIVVPSGMVKAYEKIFTKSITGSKTDLVVKAHPAAKKTTGSTSKTTSSSTNKTTSGSTGSTSKTTSSSTNKTTNSSTSSSTSKTTSSSTGSATTKKTASSTSSTATKKSTSSTSGTAKKTTSK